ncbi:MAG: hypothetical protein JWM11_6125, partial [Planctomycetaceae bacterium]|nr:hypothetical protein [Planctomycetaceae bacterium]
IWSILLLILAPCCSIADDDVIDAKSTDVYERGGGFVGEFVNESESANYSRINGFVARPNSAVLNSINVEWQPLKRDSLGNLCQMQGRLITPNGGQAKTVDWFQGFAVYIAKKPGIKLDWSKGIEEENETTVGLFGRVKKDGTFVFALKLSQILCRRDEEQAYQIGIALAEHSGTVDEQKITWKQETPVLPATIRMLKLPAAPPITRELALINDARTWEHSFSNSEKVIRAVNALRPLGKEKALQTLETYLVLSENGGESRDEEIVFWIIRLLFEPIRLNDRIPPPGIAVAFLDPQSPALPLWPIGPLELVHDIPFMLGTRCGMGGLPEQPTSQIEWVRRFGVVRDKPLTPTKDPLTSAEELITSDRFKNLFQGEDAKDDRDRKVREIRSQALDMVGDFLKPFPEDIDDEEVLSKIWNTRLAEAVELQITWDERTQRFVSKTKQK